jgi:hypothetical protein
LLFDGKGAHQMLKKLLAPLIVAALAAAVVVGCVDNSGNGNYHPIDAAQGATDTGADLATADGGTDDSGGSGLDASTDLGND